MPDRVSLGGIGFAIAAGVIASVVACAAPDAAIEARSIPGQVVDAESGEPVAGLRVQVCEFLYDVAGDPPRSTKLHRTVLSDTFSAEDGSFETGLADGVVPEGRISAVAWNADYAGFSDWSSRMSWELEHGQFPPVRLPVYSRGYALEVEAREPGGTAVQGAHVVVVPAWEGWQLATRRDTQGTYEFPELLQGCGFLQATGPNGTALFEGLPYLRLEPEDSVYGVSVSSDEHLGAGCYYEVLAGETPTCTLDLTRLDELFLSGTVVGESGEEVHFGSVLVDGQPVGVIGPGGEWRIEWEDLGREPRKITFLAEGYEPREVNVDVRIFGGETTGFELHLKQRR